MGKRFISMKEVLSRVSWSKTHVYRLIKAGTFPTPVKLGPHKIAFLESEIEAWMNQRIKARSRRGAEPKEGGEECQ